ncbi:sulfur carrier protein ThiS [Bacteroides sp.]|uniref:sulfur carrier protein ThiS n=1 Tax=Bacteroides sp. TaxID=29523 RepID=UPI00262980A2|nr:sulfur carrier protein ThiS [Bacteroides sp.]MDD3040793.1 sulfur carrier protein ThiS [Bacteroides sp.]
MKVQVNNKEVKINPVSTLTQLILLLELPFQGIAIAVNNKMIPRTEWEHFLLHENDNLIIIKAACGG